MSKEVKEENIETVNINDLKVQAFDLLRMLGRKQAEMNQLQQQVSQLEAQIIELEKKEK